MVQWRDSPLTDHDIAAVLSYVRTKKDWDHSASEVTPEQVAAIRQATVAHANNPWTTNELLKIPDSVP